MGTNIVAESTTDTVTFLAGNNITITGVAADDSIAIATTSDVTVDTVFATNNLSVGTTSPSASFRGEGDIYATSGIKAMEGLYAEAKAYGAGIEVLDNSLAVTYTNVLTGDATITAATRVIEDTSASFDSTYEGQFLRVISSTPSYTGATGEITEVLTGTTLVVSFGTAGDDTIVDATGCTIVIYPHPRFFVGDNGMISASVGTNEDAKFEIHINEGKGFHGMYINDVAAVDQHQALTIDVDPATYDGVVGVNVFVEPSEATTGDSVACASLEINADNYTSGELNFIDIAKIGSGTSNDINVIWAEGLAATDHIMHIGQPNTIERAYYDNGDGTTTDVTTEFTSQASDVTLFENDDSIIYVANETEEFTFIGLSFSTEGNRNINAEYYYCSGDNTWVTLPGVTDTTNGTKTSGGISFPNPVDRGLCDEEIDSTAFADTTDRAYIAIKRTRNNWSGDYPIENLVSIGGATYLYMDSYGVKPIGSAGAPYACSASEAGMSYYDSTAVALLWCDGATWNEYAETTDITVHNNLSGLQGGVATEYYHLDSADYTATAKIAGEPVTLGNMLIADGTDWESVVMSGDTTIDSSGVTYLANLPRCVNAANLVAADDNISMGSFGKAVTINNVWCHFLGTGTTVATITLEDGSGNAMTITDTNPTCTAHGTPPTKKTVTANNALTATELLRFDTSNTPDPVTDDYTICVDWN